MGPLMHAFVAISLPRETREQLGHLQQQLRGWAKGAGVSLDTVPRRALTLPLFDLGPVPAEAFEAVELGLAQVADQQPPFTVTLGEVGGWPAGQGPRLVHIAVQDDKGRVAALQAAVQAALTGYGFAADPRAFVPHIPLGRCVPAPNGAPAHLPGAGEPLRIRALDLMRREPSAGWQCATSWPLLRSPADRPEHQITPRDELAALLDARLAARSQTQHRAPRPRPRPAPRKGETP